MVPRAYERLTELIEPVAIYRLCLSKLLNYDTMSMCLQYAAALCIIGVLGSVSFVGLVPKVLIRGSICKIEDSGMAASEHLSVWR
jgi:hypothetical protein